MSTEVLVGLIGLGGAVLGAGAAFAGVVYQQRSQAKQEDAKRHLARTEGAIDSLIMELEAFREHAWKRPADETAQGWSEWVAGMSDLLKPMRLSMMRLSDPDLRGMLEAAWLMEFGDQEVLQEAVGLRAPRLLMLAMAAEAQSCLGHHLRGEPLPDTEFLKVAVRTASQVLRRDV